VTFSAKSAYQYWLLKGDRALLARAPQFNTEIDARVRIMPKLHAYTNLKWITFTGSGERDIVDWGLGANYALNKRFSLFLDAHNLLNHRHQYFTGYPAQGFNVMAGATVKF
jgi:predicted porin